ncbi:ODV-EC43 [Plodia interpunctella granulovirus]|uniref:ODV-EC43 n=1 Tax=Plodia interpunctella granulovirus TaxID=262175 RepID=A0A1L5JGL5_9BBAC|nr:ODV-EC43 [Plodia interpunctella granulovirus]APO13931.1 ODV-EC43 [Plodia interpunctella granulovirus]
MKLSSYIYSIIKVDPTMNCSGDIKAYISDLFIEFPYAKVQPQRDAGGAQVTSLTLFVPTFADEKVIVKDNFVGFSSVRVLKYASNFDENDDIETDTVVYWNAILPIKILGVGTTIVFNVVLSDNLYSCHKIEIDPFVRSMRCPMQVEYHPGMVCLDGEYAGDLQELRKTQMDTTEFLIRFQKDTPMGIKILNTKRLLIALSIRSVRANVCVYLPYEELTTIHKELSWEMTRKQIRGGQSFSCNVLNRSSYKYVLDAMKLIGVDSDDVSSLHSLVKIFTPLILRYKLVPTIFVELNNINGEEKHVRLYCKYESVAITNAGPVPINMATKNTIKSFTHNTLAAMSNKFYDELGTRNAFVHSPQYNYFL